jgi:hypothetical protein
MPVTSTGNRSAVVLRALAGLLVALAIAASFTGGLRLDLGPIRVSASSAGRLLFEASLCWLLATVLDRARRNQPTAGSGAALVALAAVLVGAVADSHPQRVGDGAEYVAMALNLGALRPPALSPADIDAAHAVFDASSGFERARLPPGPIGADQRRDTFHFWLYSLAAAPGVALARATGVHVNSAFTLVNGALLFGLVWILARRGHLLAAILVTVGPPLWWLDKAHAETFLFVTMAAAMLNAVLRPAPALVSAGLASGQNPAGLLVLAAAGAAAVARWLWPSAAAASDGDPRWGARTMGAAAIAMLLASLPSAYYLWHLGTWSPLAPAIARGLPTARALLTPLVDLNLGLVWHAPVLVGLAVVGFWIADGRTRLMCACVSVGLLAVFAQVVNINHGGTPGMSRYALWLLGTWMPLIVLGTDAVSRRRAWPVALVAVSVALAWFLFRPSLADRAGASPNTLASLAWRMVPSLENPLPEVFAERVSGLDGNPPVPVALPGCEKVLTRGDGADAAWPFPCEPRPAPAACTIRNALCYANGEAFVVAPSQASFTPAPFSPHAWTSRDTHGLDALLPLTGRGARHRRSTAALDRITSLDDTVWSYVVEGEDGTLAWVKARPEAKRPVVRITLSRPARVDVRGETSVAGRILRSEQALPAGRHDIAIPLNELVLLLVVDRQ